VKQRKGHVMQTQRKPKEQAAEVAAPAEGVARAVVPGLESEISASVSPALSLQQRLAEEWELPAAASHAPRWSPRSTLLFAGGASLLLWGAIAVVATSLR
jgi:hypothetical protein